MQTFTVTEPFLDLGCGLAESPFWERSQNVLRFVDIVGKCVYRVDLNKGPSSLSKLQYERSISITAELEGSTDSFLFGGKLGVGVAQKANNEYRYIQPFWTEDEIRHGKSEQMRANDGGVDSKGRFWVSTLCDPKVCLPGPEGVLFRLDLDGSLHRVLTGITIPNGMTWSKDGRTLYFTDSFEKAIFAYDFDAESGTLSSRRVFFRVKEDDAVPDGHGQDEDGNLWVAIWGGWKVVRVSPEGEVIGEVRLPTRCITAVAFAEEDIYITSETEPQPHKYSESVRYEGCVFKCHVGIRGQPAVAAKVRFG